MSKIVKLIIDDAEHTLDLSRFMLSEGIALEEKWNLSTKEFAAAVASGSPPMRVVGAMVWLVYVRELVVKQQLPFREAAELLPVTSFDVDLVALRIENQQEPENPTRGATRAPKTPATRRTSAGKRAKTA